MSYYKAQAHTKTVIHMLQIIAHMLLLLLVCTNRLSAMEHYCAIHATNNDDQSKEHAEIHQVSLIHNLTPQIDTKLLLLKAIQSNDREIAVKALAHGEDPNGISDGLPLYLETPLSYNQIPFLIRAVLKKAVSVVECLLRYGANPDIRDEYERCPLHHVQDTATAMLLLQYKADIHAIDKYGCGVLHCLSESSSPHNIPLLIQTLTENNANVNQTDIYRETPLHVLVRSKNKNALIMQELLKAKADPCARDRKGCTPLDILIHNLPICPERATLHNAIEIVKALIDAGVDPFEEGELSPAPINVVDGAGAIKHAMLEAYQNRQVSLGS